MESEVRLGRRTRSAERRGQWCLKHAKITDELRDLCWKAADKAGLGVNEWGADALAAEARRQLGEEPPDTSETLSKILERLDRIAPGGPQQQRPGVAGGSQAPQPDRGLHEDVAAFDPEDDELVGFGRVIEPPDPDKR